MSGRGQAMVELVLGSLVFITILIFGIHFAEVGYLSVKTTEAVAHATYDATGIRAHRVGSNGKMTAFSVNNMRTGFPLRTAGQLADRAYRDFDGRTNHDSGRVLTQVFTRARQIQTSCQPANVAVVNLNIGSLGQVFDYAPGPVDGMSCNSSVMLQGFNFPRTFFERSGGGYFKARHYTNVGIGVCAIGRRVGGRCDGQLTVALGDWGFAGRVGGGGWGAEWGECRPGNCENQPYYRAAERLYRGNGAAGGGAASALATVVAGSSPTNENAYHMVFRGEYNAGLPPMHNNVAAHAPSQSEWEVTPATGGYGAAYNRRDNCFLGVNCGSGPF